MLSWRALYPLIMLAGLTVSYWALRHRTERSTLATEHKLAIGWAAFVGAMLGAKLPFWLSGPIFSGEMASNGWLWIADGKTILGGIFGGYVAVEFAKFCLGIRQRTGDNFAVPIAIAVAAGRVGCFVSGCCFGQITSVPWGCSFPLAGDPAGTMRHPTQLYEVAFHGIALLLLLICERQNLLVNRRLTVYLAAYLMYRFVSEWIRPEPIFWLTLTVYQWSCVLLLVLLLLSEWRYLGQQRSGAQPH